MATETRSVFLYGKPTQKKKEQIQITQRIYTDLINVYIETMINDDSYFLDLFNNNKKASLIRSLEKQVRKSNSLYKILGSAYGQNAIDHATKELHNHFTRIKNKLYGFCKNKQQELLPYVESIALLNAAILDLNEVDVLNNLIYSEKGKEKPNQSKLDFYQELLQHLQSFSKTERQEQKKEIRLMFYEKLESWKVPFVKQATLQLDARLCKFEKAEFIQSHYVLSFKIYGQKEYISIPLKTSRNGLRRLNQYKTGSPSITLKHGQVKVTIPFEKKIKQIKCKKTLGMDVGITDLIYASNDKNYGTFSGMTTFYEKVLEPKLKRRSSLRNKMRAYQKELRKNEANEERKVWLRKKIFNIATMLNGKKELEKCKRKYAHEVNVRLNDAIKPFIEDVKKQKVKVVMESLDITEFDRGKKANKRDSSWVRGKLTTKIQSLLTWNGIPFVEVDPAYTSKTCPTLTRVIEMVSILFVPCANIPQIPIKTQV